MKPILFILGLLCCSLFSNAQSSVGLIGHWDMNGTANDVSGSGNNGVPHNLAPAAGMDGVMGDAWYFNGSDSYIWIPYTPSLNIQKYSICAKVMVMGFYSGPCVGSMIFGRGYTGPETGTYYLFISDLPANGHNCSLFDSTTEDFVTSANDFPTTSMAALNYTPYIIENKWYTMVATFNDTTFDLYANGTRVLTVNTLTPGIAMGSNTDGINIGMNTFEPGYPYPFKGVIDDIRFYDRVLTDSEIIQYTDSSATASAGNIIAANAIVIYPNPAQNNVTVQLPYAGSNGSMDLIDAMGRVITTQTIKGNTTQFDLAGLPPGMYIIKVAVNGQMIYKKVLKDQ